MAYFTLPGILAIAFGLRVWGLQQGYPDFYGHVDEVGVTASIWNFFRSGTLRPTEFTYPDLYSYLVAILVWLSVMLGKGELENTADSLILISFADPAWAVLVGRLLSAVASTLSAAVVYRLGSQAFGRRTGVVAAAFFAVSSTAVQHAHRGLPDSVMALFATLCVFYSWRLSSTGAWRHYALAGICAGLMVSTKYNGAFVSFGLVAGHLLRARSMGVAGSLLDPRLWTATALSVVTLVAGTPYLVLAWEQYQSLVSYQTSSLAFSMSDTDPWWWIPRAYLLEEHLLGGLMLAGLVFSAFRRRPLDWIVFAGWLPTFLYIGTWTRESLHYLLQFHPVMALLASRLVLEAWGKSDVGAGLKKPGVIVGSAVVIVVIVGVLMTNGVRVVGMARGLTLPDTRSLASRWIEANVPAGAKVAMTWLPYCPRLDLVSSRESIRRYAGGRPDVGRALQEKWQSRPAYRFVNLEAWLKQPVVPQVYRSHIDLDDAETRRIFSRGWRSVERLKRDGVEWVVLPEAVYERYMHASEPAPNTAAHYRFIVNRAYFMGLLAPESGLKLMARFPASTPQAGGRHGEKGPSRGGQISVFRVR